MKSKLAIMLLTVILAGVVILAVYFDKIAIFTAAKIYDTEISYKSLTGNVKRGYDFGALKIVNKSSGIGLFSSHAQLKPVWGPSSWKKLLIAFKLKDVHFIKNKESVEKNGYKSLDDLVAAPFEGRWMYKEMLGEVEIFSNGITIKNFTANGKNTRLCISGDFYYNKVVDLDIRAYFSREALKDIPEDLSNVVMKQEPGDWKSFSVKLKGDYRKASIQISGDLFRFNIKNFSAD